MASIRTPKSGLILQRTINSESRVSLTVSPPCIRTIQPHPAARGRITLGPTRANKSYNPTYQPGASPTG